MRRVYWLTVATVITVGCESLRNGPAPPTPPPPTPAVGPTASAAVVPATATWPSGPEPQSLLPPTDSLTLAAEYLERGDHATAARHLEAYVRSHPEQILFRVQLAEMLLRMGRDAAAKVHYERFAADAQSATGPARGMLVHVHTRLMEIAQRADDRFGEVFHRGVGLLTLANEQRLANPTADEFADELLCKAMKALVEARDLQPGDPRPRLYLADVYERQGNRRAADLERTAARERLVAGELTPPELNRIVLP